MLKDDGREIVGLTLADSKLNASTEVYLALKKEYQSIDIYRMSITVRPSDYFA